MSTILYEDERFLRIYETLSITRGGQEYAHIFLYPEGWDKPDGMNQHYQGFVDNLRVANIKAYNSRYEDADELEVSLLDFSRSVMPYGSNIQFCKSLRGLRYNLDNEDVNGCAEILNRLIDVVSYRIISRLPEWERADTW